MFSKPVRLFVVSDGKFQRAFNDLNEAIEFRKKFVDGFGLDLKKLQIQKFIISNLIENESD